MQGSGLTLQLPPLLELLPFMEHQLMQLVYRGIAGVLFGECLDFFEGLVRTLSRQEVSGLSKSFLLLMLRTIESSRFQQLGDLRVSGEFFLCVCEDRDAIVESLVRPAFARALQELSDALLFLAPLGWMLGGRRA